MGNEDNKWTAEEIQRYQGLRRRELRATYLVVGIPPNEPERREDYLIQRLSPILTPADEETYNQRSKEGRDKALLFLEGIAVDRF